MITVVSKNVISLLPVQCARNGIVVGCCQLLLHWEKNILLRGWQSAFRVTGNSSVSITCGLVEALVSCALNMPRKLC